MRFFYPAFCLHCSERMRGGSGVRICTDCFETIEWLERKGACPFCGMAVYDRRVCSGCRKSPVRMPPLRVCFGSEGPIRTLYDELLSYESPGVARTLASLALIGWKRGGLPFPDVIVPVPSSRSEKFDRRRHPGFLIGRELSRLFAIPFRPVLTFRETEQGGMCSVKPFFRGSLAGAAVLFFAGIVYDSELFASLRCVTDLWPLRSTHILALFDRRVPSPPFRRKEGAFR
ncbi:MAG: double zinc ribbon domain-containing protein [Simkaniaceae bacterium]|nr:double zinc ribbon domain-containing protein [Simkaniaceae bacterium]